MAERQRSRAKDGVVVTDTTNDRSQAGWVATKVSAAAGGVDRAGRK